MLGLEEKERRDHVNLGKFLCGNLDILLLYAEHEELWVREGSQQVWCEAPFVVGHPLIILKDVYNSGLGQGDAEIRVVLI